MYLEGATISFRLNTPAEPFTADVTVRSDTPDLNPANDSASLDVEPIAAPHLLLDIAPAAPLVTGRPDKVVLTSDGTYP